jgi:epoxyqueuosine reductase
LIGNRIYGCDDCLAICPWNKFASASREIKLKAREDLVAPELSKLLQLDDAAFRTLFSASPVKRIGRNRFIRNVLIASGNSGDKTLIPAISIFRSDPSELVSHAATWALEQLA